MDTDSSSSDDESPNSSWISRNYKILPTSYNELRIPGGVPNRSPFERPEHVGGTREYGASKEHLKEGLEREKEAARLYKEKCERDRAEREKKEAEKREIDRMAAEMERECESLMNQHQ